MRCAVRGLSISRLTAAERSERSRSRLPAAVRPATSATLMRRLGSATLALLVGVAGAICPSTLRVSRVRPRPEPAGDSPTADDARSKRSTRGLARLSDGNLFSHATTPASAAITGENSANRGRPPSSGAVASRYSIARQIGCNLCQALTRASLRSDATYDGGGDRRTPARRARLRPRPPRPSPLGDEPLELIHGNQLRTPRHLDRSDVREHAAVERGPADSQSFGSLRPRVRQALDARPVAHDHLGRRACRLPVTLPLLGPVPKPPSRHQTPVVHKC
jgi:hypothetical protein